LDEYCNGVEKKVQSASRVRRKPHQKAMIGFLPLLILLTIPAQTSVLDQLSFAKCLPQVESVLGKPATSKAPVYELSAVHAMEIQFDKDCQIVFVQIGPKYFWEQKVPEWVEPHSAPELSTSEYEGFLSKINQLRNTGSVVRRGDSRMSVVTNSKQYAWDEYEHAFINRVMHCCDNKSAFSVYIYFLQNVQGKIQKIRPDGKADAFPRRVMIDDKWYLIPSNQKVSLGKPAQLKAVVATNPAGRTRT
jgi:hypothetical protein